MVLGREPKWVVRMCGGDVWCQSVWSVIPVTEGVSAVGGWSGWSIGGDGVVGGGDGRVVWTG